MHNCKPSTKGIKYKYFKDYYFDLRFHTSYLENFFDKLICNLLNIFLSLICVIWGKEKDRH